MKKRYYRAAAALLIPILSVCCCACAKEARRYTDTRYDLFDTVITVTAYDGNEAAFRAHADALYDTLLEYHRLFDAYAEYDGVVNVCTLNRTACEEPVPVDGRLFELLDYGRRAYEMSSGKVNICMGSVTALWRERSAAAQSDPDAASLPEASALTEAAKHTDIGDLVLNEADGTVFFRDPSLRLDLGAVAKGYAADQAAAFAKENCWPAAVINLGGNVICYGALPRDGLWRIGIEDPAPEAETLLGTLSLTDASVVTSGDYQRYYTVGGVRYCHIIDPDTLYPLRYYSAVTVVAQSSALADALSTALFLMPPEEGERLVEANPQAEAIWVYPDGSTRESAGLNRYEYKEGAE